MRRTIILSLAAATVSVTAWCGSASAQGVKIYVGPRAYEYSDYRYRPRGYDYTRRHYNTEAEFEGGLSRSIRRLRHISLLERRQMRRRP